MALAIAVRKQRRARLSLHIDETGRNDQSGRVDHAAARFGRQIADAHDAIADDADVGALGRLATAVGDLSAADNQIEALARRAARSKQK